MVTPDYNTADAALDSTRYGRAFTMPRKIPVGRVLAHNTVRRDVATPCGFRGFRWWTWLVQDVPPHFTPCSCGWSGLPHVSQEGSRGKLTPGVDGMNRDEHEHERKAGQDGASTP